MGKHSVTDEVDAVAGWLTPDRRRRIYQVLLVLAPLLVAYGVVSQDQAELWVNVALAVLVGGAGTVALKNTPKS